MTVSGSTFSGDGLSYAHSTLPSALAENNYMDYVVDATFATYTMVQEVCMDFEFRSTAEVRYPTSGLLMIVDLSRSLIK